MSKVYVYILLMAAVTFLIRVLPLTLIRKPIKNCVLRSFLYYVPYVTLAVMTFPAIVQATENAVSGILAFVCAMVLAYFGRSLLFVAVSACAVAFVADMIIRFL